MPIGESGDVCSGARTNVIARSLRFWNPDTALMQSLPGIDANARTMRSVVAHEGARDARPRSVYKANSTVRAFATGTWPCCGPLRMALAPNLLSIQRFRPNHLNRGAMMNRLMMTAAAVAVLAAIAGCQQRSETPTTPGTPP